MVNIVKRLAETVHIWKFATNRTELVITAALITPKSRNVMVKKSINLFFIANLTIDSWCLFHHLNFLQFVKTDFSTELVLLFVASA